MPTIYKAFTAEQIYEAMRNYLVAKDVWLSDFNEGSRVRALCEAIANRESTTQFEFLNAMRKAIPVAFYDAFEFERKPAVGSSGFIRFYRRPSLVIEYTGAAPSVLLSITPTQIQTVVAAVPADEITETFAANPSVQDVVDAINGHSSGNYVATIVTANGALSSSAAFYNYVNQEMVGEFSYRGIPGRDIMDQLAPLVAIGANQAFIVDQNLFYTTAVGQIDPGNASSGQIPAAAMEAGPEGNIAVPGLDTEFGQGVMSTQPVGTDHAINDTSFSGGQVEESDDERRQRFQLFVEGLAGATVRGIESAVLAIPAVRSVAVIESFPQSGTITVVADDGSGTLPLDLQLEIIKVVLGDPIDRVNYPGKIAAGISLVVQGPSVVATPWTIVLYRIGTLSVVNDIILAAQTAVEQYVNTLKLGSDVILSEAARRIKNSHGAIFDLVISAPAANVSVTQFDLARSGLAYSAPISISLVTLTTPP